MLNTVVKKIARETKITSHLIAQVNESLITNSLNIKR